MKKEKATIEDFARMCNKNSPKCEECPLALANNDKGEFCNDLLRKFPDKANEIILKWCEEHPTKTRQEKFLEMFPNAEINKDGVIEIFPCNIEKGRYISDCHSCSREHGFSGCGECRRKYWSEEVEE